MRLTAKERRALAVFALPAGQRSYEGIHSNSIHAIERKGLIVSSPNGRILTEAGAKELEVPDIFDDLFSETEK